MSAAAAAARPRCCCAASAPAWCAGLAASAPAARLPPRFASLLTTACCPVSSATHRYSPCRKHPPLLCLAQHSESMFPCRHRVRRSKIGDTKCSSRCEASRSAKLQNPPVLCIARRMAKGKDTNALVGVAAYALHSAVSGSQRTRAGGSRRAGRRRRRRGRRP